MNRTSFLLASCLFFFACNNASKTDGSSEAESASQITQEQINNPSTADNPQIADSDLAIMSFKTTEHDFGDIVENQNVETTFEFTNTGKVDLMISNCQAACGCTVPDWPREPIAPGKSGKIKVAFNSSGRGGVNNKIVTVYANIPEKQVELKFRVNVRNLPK
ncbi:MAG: DUF1573 domain-containing protein [Bacteroidia bacterium]|nr:DUF1573 domain-containing protein [Bacteroidia bacterium]